MDSCTRTMANCEFYESIYAELMTAGTQLSSQRTSHQFAQQFDGALLELYGAVILLAIKATAYFSPGNPISEHYIRAIGITESLVANSMSYGRSDSGSVDTILDFIQAFARRDCRP